MGMKKKIYNIGIFVKHVCLMSMSFIHLRGVVLTYRRELS